MIAIRGEDVAPCRDEAFQKYEFTSCPVVLVSRPWVTHAYRAWAWWGKGQLGMLEPSPSFAMMEAIDILQAESSSLDRKRAFDDRKDAERPKRAKRKKSTGY